MTSSPVSAPGCKPYADVFHPCSAKHPEDETTPGLLLARTEGCLHFASAPRAENQLWDLVSAAKPQVQITGFGAVPDIEYTAIKMLTEAEEKLNNQGISLWL